MYVIVALGAAVMFAVSTVLKHRSAQAVGAVDESAGRGLLQIVGRTLRHPTWLCGIAVDAGALTLQIIALHLGPIEVVQPLLAISLVLALVIDHRHAPRKVWLCASVLVAALSGFVLLTGTATTNASPDAGPALIACLLVGMVVVAGVVAARRLGVGLTAAATLGVSVGTSYAASAALLKVLGNHAVGHGVIGVLGSWQLYALLACGAAGIALNQLAFAAGPLRQSLPTISAVDPVASVVLGVVVFDEPLRLMTGTGIGQVVALLAIISAVVTIARTPTERDAQRCDPVMVSAS